MIDLFGIEIAMSWLGLAVLAVGAVVIGVIGQLIGEVRTSFEWLPDAVAAFIGGFVASEMLGDLSKIGPEWEGVFLVPALVGAIVLAVVVDLLVRTVTGGTLTHRGHPA